MSSKSLNCMKLVLRVAATSAALQLLGQQVPSLLGTYCGLRMVACEAGLKIFRFYLAPGPSASAR